MALSLNFAAVLGVAQVLPVLTGSGVNTLPSTDVVIGILDPVSTQRLFNPFAEGLAPQSGQSLTDWFPTGNANSIEGAAIAATTVDDAYWGGVAAGLGDTLPNNGLGNPSYGQVRLYLTPGSLNTVEASSVMTFRLSPEAALLVVDTSTSGNTF